MSKSGSSKTGCHIRHDQDHVCREKIAKLPPEVSEVAKMEELKTYEDGEALLSQVETHMLGK